MKKIMNFRISLFYAIGIILSIVFATYVFVEEKLKLTFFFIFIGLFLILLIFFAFFKRKILIFMGVLFLITSLPFISIYSKSVSLSKHTSLDNQTMTVCGEIYDVKDSGNSLNVYLKNVSKIEESNFEKINGKLFIKIYKNNLDVSKIKTGNKIKVNTSIDFYTLQDEDLQRSLSYISRGISGYGYAYNYNVAIEETNQFNLKYSLKDRIFGIFNKIGNNFAFIGYAMMFGESSILDSEIKGIFSDSGTLHLFSVSGLHVSLIVLVLAFILDKLKSKKCIKMLIIALFLLFYCYICDFSISVIRASLMSLIALYAVSRHKEYDYLSSLSLVCLAILLVSPLHLFNVSFVLSFISVLSIILLKPIFERFFAKFFYDRLSSLLAITLSASFGLTLAQLYYFKSVSVFAFVSNLITVPLASVMFIFLFFAVIVSLIFPFASFLISILSYFSRFIVGINSLILKSGIVINSARVSEAILATSIVFMFLISDYIFLNKKYKIPISMILLGFMAVLFVF